MKATLLLLAPLINSIPLETRQHSLLDIINSLPSSYSLHPLARETVEPAVRATATRKLIRYGPFKLFANQTGAAKAKYPSHKHSSNKQPEILDILLGKTAMDPAGSPTMQVLPDPMCTNCTILAGKIDAVFDNGTKAKFADGVYLHHAIIMDLNKKTTGYVRSPPCGNSQSTMRGPDSAGIAPFIAGGVDDFKQHFTSPDGMFNSGYHLDSSKFMMQMEMVNYLPTEQTVHLLVDIEYVDGQVGGDVTGVGFSAPACNAGRGWRPAKNTSAKVEVDGFKIINDGYILSARAHMHDGGTAISLYHNGKLYCTSHAIYGGEMGTMEVNGKHMETISKLTECIEPLKVNIGDTLKIEAFYDTAKHPLRESQGQEQEFMAIMGTMFAEDAIS